MQVDAVPLARLGAPVSPFRLSGAGHALLILPLAVFVTIFMIVPVALVLANSFSAEESQSFSFTLRNFYDILADPFYWQVTFRSLRISLVATIAALVVGYPAVLYIYFSQSKWRRVFLFLVVSPLFISAVVRTYGWMMILTPSGALNWLLPTPLHVNLMRTEAAVTLGLMHIYVPFMILSINAALIRLDKRLLIAAASLGASKLRIFRDIIFPLSVPGVVAGSVIVFAVSMTAFGTPVLLGGSGNKTLAYMAYQKNLMLANPHEGGAAAVILVLWSLGTVWVFGLMAKPFVKRLGGNA